MIRLTNAAGDITLNGPGKAECLNCGEQRDCAGIIASVRPDWVTYLCGQCITTALARLMVDRIAADEGRDRETVAAEIVDAAR